MIECEYYECIKEIGTNIECLTSRVLTLLQVSLSKKLETVGGECVARAESESLPNAVIQVRRNEK